MATKTIAQLKKDAEKLGQILVEFEKKHFDARTGKKHSNPKTDFFAPKAWAGWKDTATRLGWSINTIHYAPKSVDCTFVNPDKTGFDKAGKFIQEVKEKKA